MKIRQPVPVLITARELDQGGVERDVAKMALRLDRSRFEPHVATYYARGLRYEELLQAGIPILQLPLTSLISALALRSAVRLMSYIRKHQIRVVHSYDASGVFCLPVARLMGVPAVIGSQLSYRSILDPRTQRLLRWSDHVADVVLANCDAIRDYLVRDEQVPAERVERIYNGVVTTEFYPDYSVSRPERLASASLVIGTVCVLRPEKALSLLQEAFARIRSLRDGLTLVFVGSGPGLGELQHNAEQLGIAGDVVFVPATREVARWMRAMDIFVLPSYSEAFSNSLLEAMACGCAVVGSRIGGTPELIGANDERGFLFECRNASDLADKLARLINDDNLRRNLAQKAASFVRQNLTIEIAAERTAAMYERLLERKTGSKSSFASDADTFAR